MSDQLKIKKEIKGTALIELGNYGTAVFETISVYSNESSDTDIVLLIVDKKNPTHKIQLTLSKEKIAAEVPDEPEAKVEPKPEEPSEPSA